MRAKETTIFGNDYGCHREHCSNIHSDMLMNLFIVDKREWVLVTLEARQNFVAANIPFFIPIGL